MYGDNADNAKPRQRGCENAQNTFNANNKFSFEYGCSYYQCDRINAAIEIISAERNRQESVS